MSATTIANRQDSSKKYGLTLTQINIQQVVPLTDMTKVAGSCGFELESPHFSNQNRIVPDLTNDIKGDFEPDQDATIELESDLTLEEVKQEIMEYLDKHEHAQTSDIIFDLCIDPQLVSEALEALEKENLVEGNDVQTKTKQ
jgi:hypothetical protein